MAPGVFESSLCGHCRPGLRGRRFVQNHLPFSLIVLSLVGTRVDFKKHVVFFYFSPFFERRTDQIARDARHHAHGFWSFDAPGEVDIVGHLPFDRMADWNCWGFRRSNFQRF